MKAAHTPTPLEIPPDAQTIQQCCLVYGGHSFSGPMKEALTCHLGILAEKYPVLVAAPALRNACKKLSAFVDEVLPQAGKLCFDIGKLNDALILAQSAIALAEKGE